jgi:hypothetical protein
MASEDRSSPPQRGAPHRLSQSDPRYLQPAAQPSMSSMSDTEHVRSRGSSSARQDGYTSDSSRYSNQASRPVKEAVNSAFNSTNAVDTGIPPELLERLTSQITANVIRELKTANINTPNSQAADTTSSAGSPPLGRASVYTPPSPYRTEPTPSVTRSPRYPVPSVARDDRFPSPHPSPKASVADRMTPPPDHRAMSPSNISEPADDSDANRSSRPRAPQRVSTSGDMTVLEKIWGKLFDDNGQATPRLEQLLRGIAVHLIEDYEPKNSLVITPPKMQEYYKETALTEELYPWQLIFDDRTSSISRMLRELEVEHHLVQPKLSERPEIPGVTPAGFAAWATLLIKAHPEQEFERLAKTLVDMPVNNPDDKKERFPKELTRRLLPKQPDPTVAAALQKAMSVHCNVKFRSRTESSAGNEREDDLPLRSSQDSMGASRGDPIITPVTSNGSIPQRTEKSQSISSEPQVFVESEDENTPTPQPIERERKPYVANLGGGKNYDNIAPNGLDTKPTASTSDIKSPPQEAKIGRSHSMRSSDRSERYRPAPISLHQPSGTAPIEIPESRNYRTSAYRREGPSGSAPRRARSPSTSKDYPSSSRTLDPQDMSSHYPSLQPHSAGFEPSSVNSDRDRRYRDYESARRERFPDDRYDAARMSAYDPRDRERDRERVDTRPRGQSIANSGLNINVDQARATEEEYYRSAGKYSGATLTPVNTRRDEYERTRDPAAYQPGIVPPTAGHYPPNAYRDGR